jgi:hypothetical protein
MQESHECLAEANPHLQGQINILPPGQKSLKQVVGVRFLNHAQLARYFAWRLSGDPIQPFSPP